MNRINRAPASARSVAAAFAALLVLWSLSAAAATTIGHGEDIDWRTSPLDLNLRGLNGERFRFHCPSGKPAAGQVVGSGLYTDGSSICAAAVHAGALMPAAGGPVTIEVRPGQSHYAASLSHYVQSQAYEPFWSGSFLVIADADKASPASQSPATAPPDPT